MQKNNLFPLESLQEKEIEKCIYNIRGQQVMLDSDVAYFFQTTTSNLNRQMQRNMSRFPVDFCFQLNSLEFKSLLCQIGISNNGRGGVRKLPYVYTEHGVIALAGVLRSEVADRMSVEIARKFIQMKKFILENGDTLLALARLQNRQLEFEKETNNRFDEILNAMAKLDLPKEATFYAGDYYDAYEFISSIISRAKKRIVVIDPYCDSKIFTYLKNRSDGVNITICKSNMSKLLEEEISTFISQYGNINIVNSNDIHDRFLVADDECYSLGASINYMGKKFFAINKIENHHLIDMIVKVSNKQQFISTN